jgi:DNA-binding beta-propeller fold protein YncE
VSVLDARQSKVLHVVHVPTAVDFSGAAVDATTNRVFIAGGGSVSVLDGRSGALLQTISLEEDRFQAAGMGLEIAPMAVDDRTGRVFVLGPGILRVLDAGTGRMLRSIPISMNATALALDPRHGHLLLTTTGATDNSGTIRGPGSLQVLDPRTGAVLRTISLGAAPSALVVDERANSVIVVDSGGEVQATNSLGWLPDGLRQRLPFLPAQKSTTRTEPGSVTVLDLSRL